MMCKRQNSQLDNISRQWTLKKKTFSPYFFPTVLLAIKQTFKAHSRYSGVVTVETIVRSGLLC